MNKMNLTLSIVITIVIFFTGTLSAGEIKDRSEEIISSTFETSNFTGSKKFVIPKELKREAQKICRQKFFKDYVYYWEITDGDSLQAIALLDNVYGKSMPITFMVIFDMEGKIIRSEIIKYREQYGGAVKSESWNKQFKKKDAKSSYIIGSDIAAISGATISVKSVTRGIRKLSIIYNSLKDSL